MRKKHFIGIDISKDHLDVALLKSENATLFKDKKVSNTIKGFNSIIIGFQSRADLNDCLICMELTGTYGLLLCAWLNQLSVDFCVEPGIKIKRSAGLTRGKNDKVDAYRIAEYAHTNRMNLTPFSMPSGHLLQIRQLLTYRDPQTKIKVSLKNSLKSHDQYQNVGGISGISEEIKQQIKECDQRIQWVDKQSLN